MAPNNQVQVFEEGDRLIESIWRDIEGARREILVETYIIEDDRVGGRVVELLESAARRGCRAVLLHDAVGSMNFPRDRLAAAAQAGVSVAAFNSPLAAPRGMRAAAMRFGVLQRDHRKLIVVDGRVAYTGGANLSEDYAGPEHGNGRFDDTHLRIVGPAVRLLRETLITLLAQSRVELPSEAPGRVSSSELGSDAAEPDPAAADAASGVTVQVLESSGWRKKREIQRELRLAIECASFSLDITTPYFVPPERIVEALIAAARRGVRVRLLTAGRSDVPVMAFAARHVYERLLRRGVQIFEMDSPIVHAKTTIADGLYALVGSANMDQWSYRRNLELNVGLFGELCVARLEAGFERRRRTAREVTLRGHSRRGWWRSLLEWAAYTLMRL
jgi:cardiolipin synthase